MSSGKLQFVKVYAVNVCDLPKPTVKLDRIYTDISIAFKPQLLAVLNNFKDNFVTGTPIGHAYTESMQIRHKDPNKTYRRRPYRLSSGEKEIVQDKIKNLFIAKIIHPNSSSFASPILLVKKKDGSDRLCVDYRELNDNTSFLVKQ